MRESPSKNSGSDNMSFQKNFMLYLHDLIYMLSLVMILFLLFFRVVIVSGPSMNSSLWDGDWLLVTTSTPLYQPKHGDIIIASKQSFNNGESIVKRVIATEKQTVDIDFVSGVVYVDGIALEEPYTFTATNVQEGMAFPLTVEENCVFVMGDNRNQSKDSRSPEIGLIDRREILGKAFFLAYPGTAGGTIPRNLNRIGVLK